MPSVLSFRNKNYAYIWYIKLVVDLAYLNDKEYRLESILALYRHEAKAQDIMIVIEQLVLLLENYLKSCCETPMWIKNI